MGMRDWDDEQRGRAQRTRRPPEADGGSSYRMMRGDDRDRSWRDDPRGQRPPGRDVGGRSGGRNPDPPRGYRGDPDRPTNSGNRRRPPTPDESGRGGVRDVPSERRTRRPADDYDPRGDRTARGGRPGRGETWEPASRDPRRGPPGASGRGMPRGGLWDDEPDARRGPPGRQDVRGRGGPRQRMDPRDPRALRSSLVSYDDDEDEESRGGFSAGKGLLVVFLMLLFGMGAAYGYFRMSTPTLRGVTPAAAPTNGTPAAGTPSTSPTGTPPATGALGSNVAYTLSHVGAA